jgi:hypothetical protein
LGWGMMINSIFGFFVPVSANVCAGQPQLIRDFLISSVSFRRWAFRG